MLAPRVGRLTFDVMAAASSLDGLATATATNTGPNAPIALKVPRVTLWLPAKGASHEELTTVIVTEPSSDVKRVRFSPPNDADYFGITIVTTASSVTIPDLSTLGHALRMSTTYTWSLQRFGDGRTVDDAAGEVDVPILSKVPWVTESAARTFTTAPWARARGARPGGEPTPEAVQAATSKRRPARWILTPSAIDGRWHA